MKRINQMEPWIGEEEKRAIMEYLDSGGWLTDRVARKLARKGMYLPPS